MTYKEAVERAKLLGAIEVYFIPNKYYFFNRAGLEVGHFDQRTDKFKHYLPGRKRNHATLKNAPSRML